MLPPRLQSVPLSSGQMLTKKLRNTVQELNAADKFWAETKVVCVEEKHRAGRAWTGLHINAISRTLQVFSGETDEMRSYSLRMFQKPNSAVTCSSQTHKSSMQDSRRHCMSHEACNAMSRVG